MIFKCKMCGGSLEIAEGSKICTCEFCGTTQTLPSVRDENVQALFNRATVLRMKSEFDKASEIYEKIIHVNIEEAEAYWGLILCKYGIEYVEDPVTYKRIPTCHRASYDAVVTDDDYKNAIQYANMEQRLIFEEQAKQIDEIQKGIIALAQKEDPYDIFICYKESDENGRRTPDSVIANDIYYQLKQEGYKVFYAAITLEDKLGKEYEPYIFSALNTSKVMLAIGTKPEYFQAVWVKNEWSRFLKIMKKDRSRLLIPCFKDMDAYELPEEFAHLQAQDMSKIGFINDIVRGIKKVIAKGADRSAERTYVPAQSNVYNPNIAPLLERAFLFLEDGKWQDANIYCEKVLDIDPKNAEAYLGKLMADLQVRSRGQLADCAEPFDDRDNYGKVLRFGDGKLENEMRGYITHINERNENARLTGIYNGAVDAMNAANSEAAYKAAAKSFKTIPGFKDADTLAGQCLDKAEVCRKDAIYASARTEQIKKSIAGCEAAIRIYVSISGWKDADEQIYACQRKIDEIKVKQEADRLERERQAELNRIAAEKAAKKRKIIVAIVTAIVVACIAFVIVLTTIIIPNSKYNSALDLYNAGKYDEAIAAFKELNGYKDSNEQITKCEYYDAISLIEKGDTINAYERLIALNGYMDSAEKAKEIFVKYKNLKLQTAAEGEIVYWGTYEQDNNTSNGKEDIEWLVLAKEGDKALLISKYALDRQRYNTTATSVNWETCSLRNWLNGTFLSEAFSPEEQNIIIKSTVTADKNPVYDTSPGNNTTDKVFMLSITEVNKYFSSDSARECSVTAYAKAQGTYSRWWLRSPGFNGLWAAYVRSDGSVYEYGSPVDHTERAVRPALWVDISNL